MPSPCPVCERQYRDLRKHLVRAADNAHREWRRSNELIRQQRVCRARGPRIFVRSLVVDGKKRRSAAQEVSTARSANILLAAQRSAARKKKSRPLVAAQLQTTGDSNAHNDAAQAAAVVGGGTARCAPSDVAADIDVVSDSGGDDDVVGVVGAVVPGETTAAGEAAHTAGVICLTDERDTDHQTPPAVPAVVGGGVVVAAAGGSHSEEPDVIVVDGVRKVSYLEKLMLRIQPKQKASKQQGTLSFAPRPVAAPASTGSTPAGTIVGWTFRMPYAYDGKVTIGRQRGCGAETTSTPTFIPSMHKMYVQTLCVCMHVCVNVCMYV